MLLLVDSFDHYTTLANKGWSVGVTGTAPTIAAEGRTASCAKWAWTTSGSLATMSFTPVRAAATVSGAIGFACQWTGLSTINAVANYFFSPLQAGESGLLVRLNTDGTLTLSLADAYGGYTTLGTSSGALTEGTWTYVEFKWVIASSGSFTIAINGTTVLTYSGNTLSPATPTAQWESVRLMGYVHAVYVSQGLMGISGSGSCRIDDLYLLDLSGSYNTDLLGNVTVECLLPQTDAVSAGTHADWTCSTGSDHGALVDETSPDGDTTYVSTDAAGQDSWQYPALGVSAGTIYGVQVSTAAKTDTGTATCAALAVIDSGDYQGATTHTVDAGAYIYYRHLWERNPVDSSAWTPTDVSGAEFGVERTA